MSQRLSLAYDTGACPMDFAGDGCPSVEHAWEFEPHEVNILRDLAKRAEGEASMPYVADVYRRFADFLDSAVAHAANPSKAERARASMKRVKTP